MLENFVAQTRCCEPLLEALLAEPPGGFGSEAENGGDRRAARHPDAPMASLQGAAAFSSLAERAARGEIHAPATLHALDAAVPLFQREKYLDNSIESSRQPRLGRTVRQAYYLIRPLLPVAVRKHLQRSALSGWESIPFPSWPVDLTVEHIVTCMWRSLLTDYGVEEIPFIWFWPEGYSAACMLSHDVETQIGRDYCAAMLEIERQYGVRSAFEIIPEERYEVPEDFLGLIREAGGEICIHGLNHDGNLFTSEAIFFERAKKINGYAKAWGARGFRSPVMYRNLEWLYALNFSYDMSVPNVAHLDPQRGGCCTIFPYFIGNTLELPLTTIQDYSLFHILQQRSLDMWKQQIARIREHNGLISFIIHPDYVNEDWSSGVYKALLAYLSELRADQGVWIALPGEIDDWWRARAKMRLEPRDGGWTIVGPQAERARLAYAVLQDGRIGFRLP